MRCFKKAYPINTEIEGLCAARQKRPRNLKSISKTHFLPVTNYSPIMARDLSVVGV